MPTGIRVIATPKGTIRNAGLCILLATLALVASAGALEAQEPPVTKYFVQVKLSTSEDAKALAEAGFDVAGVSPDDRNAGVVATYDDLKRLYALGWSYTIERLNTSAESIEALADYTDPHEMSVYLDQVVAAYPTLVQKIALTAPLFAGETQYALKITKDVAVDNNRPSFILDAQHHAREVMTPEIARDMIDYLTSRYATDTQVQRWVDNINIWIVPSVNPDGAMYVFTTDNMWRKNRHPTCQVDINRNYVFAWGSCNGSSGACADETYRGVDPGSEPESQGISTLTGSVRPFFTLSYHSYGEYMLYPYGCSDPDEMAAINDVAVGLNNILLERRRARPPSRWRLAPARSTPRSTRWTGGASTRSTPGTAPTASRSRSTPPGSSPITRPGGTSRCSASGPPGSSSSTGRSTARRSAGRSPTRRRGCPWPRTSPCRR